MPLKLMYITNRTDVARAAEAAGVDWVFVDLETLGKERRQGHMDSVKSHHTVEDIRRVRRVLTKAKLLTRIDPIHEGSAEQIDQAVEAGTDFMMLPMWRTPEEVSCFLQRVNGRCKTVLLLETKEAVACLDEALTLPGIDGVHIGLNDLHLSRGDRFLFEPLTDGTVERICGRLQRAGIPYGFGGVGRPGSGTLPAEHIIGEHVRLGSGMVILSRSFCDVSKGLTLPEIQRRFREGVRDVRDCEARFAAAGPAALEENRRTLCREVAEIVSKMGREK